MIPTIVICGLAIILAFVAGRSSVHMEEKKPEDPEKVSDDYGYVGPLAGEPGSTGPMGSRGLPGERGEQGPRGPGIDEAILSNGMSVQEFADHVMSRLTRVERKAGMSV